MVEDRPRVPVVKTDSDGHTWLTKQQIIDNTELKWGNYIESVVPTKFELYVWEGQSITTLIEAMKRLLSLYKDEAAIEKDLLGRGSGKIIFPRQ